MTDEPRATPNRGPYNAEALAARSLAALADLSPAYLRAFRASLEDLAALTRLPEPRRKRRAAGRRR